MTTPATPRPISNQPHQGTLPEPLPVVEVGTTLTTAGWLVVDVEVDALAVAVCVLVAIVPRAVSVTVVVRWAVVVCGVWAVALEALVVGGARPVVPEATAAALPAAVVVLRSLCAPLTALDTDCPTC